LVAGFARIRGLWWDARLATPATKDLRLFLIELNP
jgi:hypothetical protein